MKPQSAKASIEKAYGEKLANPLNFTYSWDSLETMEEVKTANETLSNEEIIDVVNNRRKASARAKETEKQLKAIGIEKPGKDDPRTVTAQFLRSLINAGKDENEARELAKTILGDKYCAGANAE